MKPMQKYPLPDHDPQTGQIFDRSVPGTRARGIGKWLDDIEKQNIRIPNGDEV